MIALVIVFISDDWIANNWLKIETLDKNEVAFKWLVGLYKGAINGFEQQIWSDN